MDQSNRTPPHPAPVSDHPLFPALVTAWFSALFGGGTLAVHPALLDAALARRQIDLPIAALAARIDLPAHWLIALAMTALGGVLGVVVARSRRHRRNAEPPAREVEIVSIRALDLLGTNAPHHAGPTAKAEPTSPTGDSLPQSEPLLRDLLPPEPLTPEPTMLDAAPTAPVAPRQVFGMPSTEEILLPPLSEASSFWPEQMELHEPHPAGYELKHYPGSAAATAPMVIFPDTIAQGTGPVSAPSLSALDLSAPPVAAPAAQRFQQETGHALRAALTNLQRINGLA